jgi:hypothetical protein
VVHVHNKDFGGGVIADKPSGKFKGKRLFAHAPLEVDDAHSLFHLEPSADALAAHIITRFGLRGRRPSSDPNL